MVNIRVVTVFVREVALLRVPEVRSDEIGKIASLNVDDFLHENLSGVSVARSLVQ